MALFAGVAVSLSAASAHADCPELLQNNEFNSGIAPWNVVSTPQTSLLNVSVSNDQFLTLNVSILDFSSATYVVEVSQAVPVVAGESYNVSFYMDVAYAVQVRTFVGSATSTATYGLDQTAPVSPNAPISMAPHYSFVATATDPNAKFAVSWLNSSSGIVSARLDSPRPVATAEEPLEPAEESEENAKPTNGKVPEGVA